MVSSVWFRFGNKKKKIRGPYFLFLLVKNKTKPTVPRPPTSQFFTFQFYITGYFTTTQLFSICHRPFFFRTKERDPLFFWYNRSEIKYFFIPPPPLSSSPKRKKKQSKKRTTLLFFWNFVFCFTAEFNYFLSTNF